jgi:RNA polymerase sigma factor (sigma-70 family)
MCDIFDVKPDSLINSETAIADELKTVIPEIVEKDDLVSCINSFLGKLTEKERIVFMLRYNLFLDNKTIAYKTGTSNGYIRNMLARTRKKLKKFLRRTEQ